MQDIRYTPKRQNTRPVILVTILTVICILSAAFMMLNIGKQLVFQIVFLLSAVVEIFMFSRFLTASYTYTVSFDNDLFVVTQKTGKRITTLCRLSLGTLSSVRPYTQEDDSTRNSGDRYNYCVSFRPAVTYLAFFRDGERTVSIRMELDNAFYGMLQRIAEDNAARAQDESENGEED